MGVAQVVEAQPRELAALEDPPPGLADVAEPEPGVRPGQEDPRPLAQKTREECSRGIVQQDDLRAGGTADARFDQKPNGKRRFVVRLHGVDPNAAFELTVDSVLFGTIGTNSGGKGRLDFRSNGGGKGKSNGAKKTKKQVLPSDPRGLDIKIRESLSGTFYFSGPMLAQIQGINVCTPSAPPAHSLTVLAGPGTATSAEATQDDCNVSLTVALTGVLADDYDLTITDSSANVLATATISAVDMAGTVTGQVVFDTNPDTAAGEQLLDFDPSGQTLQIERTSDATVIVDEVLP